MRTAGFRNRDVRVGTSSSNLPHHLSCKIYHGSRLKHTIINRPGSPSQHSPESPVAAVWVRDRGEKGQNPSRRTLLALAFTSLVSAGPATAADFESWTDEDIRAAIEGTTSVVPALTVDQYVQKIRTAWPMAQQQLASLIDESSFKEAAEALVIYPFDDVAQSCFFLPWAMLRVSVPKAIEVQRAYNEFDVQLQSFTKICRAAANYRAEDEEVVASLQALSKSLDGILAAVM
mmetsp:Transcript_21401/g.46865  ORF Transcript_21401/g.46865 Transcript_21401/m.46865 type:complete len:232 (+) Transcript_21401:233-928(+)